MAARKTKTASEPKIRKRGVAPFIEKYYNEYYTIETYPADKCVAFNTVAGEWGILGNFARTPLVVNGVTFSSSEQLYQIMKFKDADVIRKVYAGVTFKGINKGTVKMVARSYENQGFRREDWGWILLDALKFCIQWRSVTTASWSTDCRKTPWTISLACNRTCMVMFCYMICCLQYSSARSFSPGAEMIVISPASPM